MVFSNEILFAGSLKSSSCEVTVVVVTVVGIGVGLVLALFLVSFFTNPELENQLFSYTILGFALAEAIALFALMMSFFILFV